MLVIMLLVTVLFSC